MARLTTEEAVVVGELVEREFAQGGPHGKVVAWFIQDAPEVLKGFSFEGTHRDVARRLVALCDDRGWSASPAWMRVLLREFEQRVEIATILERLQRGGDYPPRQGDSPATNRLPAQKARILFLAANPTDTTRMDLGHEYAEIDEGIQRSDGRDHVELHFAPEVRIEELSLTLRRHLPDVLHFSLHGDQAGQMMLPDRARASSVARPEALAEIIGVASRAHPIRCVVLNACYSRRLAELLVTHVDCAIGTTDEVPDGDAIRFGREFYTSLAGGASVEGAWRSARAVVESRAPRGDVLPQLLCRAGVRPGDVRLRLR